VAARGGTVLLTHYSQVGRPFPARPYDSPVPTDWALALHPIHPAHAGSSPVVLVFLAVLVVSSIAVLWPGPRPTRERQEDVPLEPWTGRLTAPQVATRTVGVVLLVLTVLTGRLGSNSELLNLAPALAVGFGWPALVFASAVAGPVWRRLDPWDALARGLGGAAGERASDVRLALIPASALAWYLAAYPDALSPRSVGLALGVYAVAMVAGALAAGRIAWLSRVDVFGILFSWLARMPRGRLRSWRPPRGAELVLGVLAGGLAFGQIRTSAIWGELNVARGALVYATLAELASALLVAGALWALARWALRVGAGGSVAAAALPAVASIALVVAMARSRLFTSLQLLPSLVSDPFGAGSDLFGTRDLGILPPLDPLALAGVQLTTLFLGHVAGAIVLAGRAPREGRRPGIVALSFLVSIGVVAVGVAPGL